jgi:hypothetical protein
MWPVYTLLPGKEFPYFFFDLAGAFLATDFFAAGFFAATFLVTEVFFAAAALFFFAAGFAFFTAFALGAFFAEALLFVLFVFMSPLTIGTSQQTISADAQPHPSSTTTTRPHSAQPNLSPRFAFAMPVPPLHFFNFSPAKTPVHNQFLVRPIYEMQCFFKELLFVTPCRENRNLR